MPHERPILPAHPLVRVIPAPPYPSPAFMGRGAPTFEDLADVADTGRIAALAYVPGSDPYFLAILQPDPEAPPCEPSPA